ncbi:MAG: hypothetical protein ABIV13_02555 [Fimbriimonadales bacterium]
MLVLAPLAAASLMGGFGQFAFGHRHTLPAFDLDPTAFTARTENALTIRLGPERAGIVTEKLSRFGKTIALRPAGNAPVRIDYEATSLGFSLRYVNGMEWSAEGEAPPFITWSEGTVGPGVPAAPEGWALLTWRNPRPPLLLVFSNPVSLRSEKTDTGFSLSSPRWTGTVSVRLPFGKRSVATASAADFGGLLAELRPLLPYMVKPAPLATGATVTPHADGYEVAVRFDSPGAAVPPPAIENQAVKVLSPIVENGPVGMPICATDELRFVVRAPGALPTGTPLTYRAGRAPATSPTPQDRVLSYLVGNCTQEETHALGLLEPLSPKITEPLTNTPIPLALDGSGTAAAALRGLELLMQGKSAGAIDGLFATIDWVTWLPSGGAEEQGIAGSALAIAGPFCERIDNRALAAMANAATATPNPWHEMQNAIYTTPKPEWYAAFLSPIRILSPGVNAIDVPGGIKIGGSRETIESFEISVRSDTPTEIVATENIKRNMIIGTGAVTTIRAWPNKFGEWSLTFRRSAVGSPIPKAVPSPRYSVIQR